ncbi:lysoplasmalogenase [Erythrobacter sp. LQ02-29]|uniref:lysoplasmalogenase n=1 Tax=Erythrobacter sp. LQ02-29 TaxID=2920384 RepID=UPI001F4EE6D4|nr:lysoplasmalogenase [Erythrobacter sp. LQ02-29]MCP9223272.1 lysoplasmalogenase [Erythrobacter sp. LQ02-29]
MPKRALIDRRPWLFAAIVAAIAYFVLRGTTDDYWIIALKGAPVAALAIYAAERGLGVDGQLLTLVLGLGALGDMLLEIDLLYGGAAFFAGHLAGIVLYLRNRRANPAGSQVALAVALFVFTPALAWLLSGSLQVSFYGLGLGAMAATAWLSSFPRYRVGIGAILFVVSDLLIFGRGGGMVPGTVAAWLIWPLYAAGQFLIATGVVQSLRRRDKADRREILPA